ncbi:MAG TPA: hypothetical protein VHC98_01360 [Candidatus Saccharimonadales bacterium]|nr:hypothetical protein [Candidatus Saccharimonadales bacterium]
MSDILHIPPSQGPGEQPAPPPAGDPELSKLEPAAAPAEQEAAVEAPVPERQLEVDADLAAAWVQEETDPELQQVRQRIVDSIDCVSFDTFRAALHTTAEQLQETLQGQHYAMLWDSKPHSSKRWVSQLLAPDIAANPPAAQTFFTSGWERMNGCPTVERLVAQGLTTFVVPDDAIYSGEQIIQRSVRPIYELTHTPEFRQRYPDAHIKMVITAPYMSSRFLESNIVKALTAEGFIEIVPPAHIMPTLTERLTSEEQAILAKHEGRLTPDGDVFYQAPTTVFDHRIPDGHSFPDEVRGVFASTPQKPYDLPGTPYYAAEEQLFETYKAPLLQQLNQR